MSCFYNFFCLKYISHSLFDAIKMKSFKYIFYIFIPIIIVNILVDHIS